MTGPAPRLQQVLGFAFGVAIIVGNSISVGILRTPGEVAAQLPGAAWFLGVWVAGGVYALGGAMTLAELGAMLPRSGGQYVFARRAFGEYAGFVIGWTDWISTNGASAAGAIALGELGGQLWPTRAPSSGVVGAAVVAGLALVQWIGIRTSDRFQQQLSLLKMLALLALALACLFSGHTAGAPAAGASPAAPPPIAPSGALTLAALVLAFQGVLYTYDGWNGIFYFGGEMLDPGRAVPRATAAGVLAVATVYVLLNAAFVHVLGLGPMRGEPFVASAAAHAVFGTAGERVIQAATAITVLGGVNAIILIASRIPHAMAEDHLLPAFVARVNRGGTPGPALMLSAIATITLVLTGTFNTVLALAAFFYVLQYAVSFSALFALRRMEPGLARPYRAWGYPLVPAMVLLGALVFLAGSFWGDRENTLRSVMVLVLSYPIYRVLRRVRPATSATTDS